MCSKRKRKKRQKDWIDFQQNVCVGNAIWDLLTINELFLSYYLLRVHNQDVIRDINWRPKILLASRITLIHSHTKETAQRNTIYNTHTTAYSIHTRDVIVARNEIKREEKIWIGNAIDHNRREFHSIWLSLKYTRVSYTTLYYGFWKREKIMINKNNSNNECDTIRPIYIQLHSNTNQLTDRDMNGGSLHRDWERRNGTENNSKLWFNKIWAFASVHCQLAVQMCDLCNAQHTHNGPNVMRSCVVSKLKGKSH